MSDIIVENKLSPEQPDYSNGSAGVMLRENDLIDDILGIKMGDTVPDTTISGDYSKTILSAAVTPEMFGSFGDGVNDDAPSLKQALETQIPVVLTRDLHIFSNIVITDKNVTLLGNGHTIYLHGRDMTRDSNDGYGGQCIRIMSKRYPGELFDADVISYTDNNTVYTNPGFPDQSWYRRGYISYHGFNPTPTKEVYSDYTAYSWYEHSANIRNLKLVGDNVDGMIFLQLLQMCKSTIDNCEAIVLPGHDAAIGFQANNAYNCVITRCRAEGFYCERTRKKLSTGYAIQAIGDGIIISHCITKNCKNHINIGGGSGSTGVFTTGAMIVDCVMQQQDQKTVVSDPLSDAYKTQQMLDLHEGCINPIIENIQMEYDNCMSEDAWGTPIHFSCPEFTASNIHVEFKGSETWAIGTITLGPLVKKAVFNNISARRCRLLVHGWGFERGAAYDANYIKEVYFNGGEIAGIGNARGLVKIYLNGVKITDKIKAVKTIFAQDCVFTNEDQVNNDAIIHSEGDTFLTHCEIKGNCHDGAFGVVIRAPEDSVYMTGCVIHKKLDLDLFNTPQYHIVNCKIDDGRGIRLGSRVGDNYVDGEECYLDSYNLW